LGHLFSPFLNFKGGKGIATAFGVILAFSPLAALFAVLVFGAALYFTRYVSLGSILGVLTFLVFVLLQDSSLELRLISTALALLLIISHRMNISRLLSGTENKI
jgi:glycerol-3-phosphate acyltransferase PlsY